MFYLYNIYIRGYGRLGRDVKIEELDNKIWFVENRPYIKYILLCMNDDLYNLFILKYNYTKIVYIYTHLCYILHLIKKTNDTKKILMH